MRQTWQELLETCKSRMLTSLAIRVLYGLSDTGMPELRATNAVAEPGE